MFYEMLSGERPFMAETVSEIVRKHLSDDPPPFSPTLDIPKRLSAGIMQALSKDPDQRPQTATDLARQLNLL